MMDSEDDDIYPAYDPSYDQSNERGAIKTEPDAEEEGEDAEDDSDEDINFITDVKEEPKPDLKSQTKRPSSTGRTTSEQPKISDSPQRRRASQSQSHDIKAEPQSPQDDKPGTEYPGRHTSKIDVNANPVHPGTGKPILSTDFDSDFPTESTKPWRKPGADITDYFNYGFDEFTWASYCLKQQQMPKQVKEINQEAEQMKAFVEGIPGGGGMPGMPGAPTGPGGGMPGGGAPGGMPGMPGMPSEAEMQQMFSTMMAQGMDPSQMDQNQFMQMMMGGAGNMMGGNQPPSGPGGGFGGGVGGGGFDQGPMYGDGGGRGRGRGRRGRGW